MKSKLEILEKVHSGEISPEDGALLLKQLLSNVKFYTEKWIEQPMDKKNIHQKESGKVLIFCNRKRKQYIEETFAETQSIFISKADSYRKISEKEYCINCEREADYAHLFQEMTKDCVDIDAIIHLWAMDAEIDEKPEESGVSILNIGKQLLRLTIHKDTPFVHVYPIGESINEAVQSAVFAIFCSLKEETSRLKGKSIAMDSNAQVRFIEVVKEELKEFTSQHIKYLDGKRFVKSYQPLNLEKRSRFIQKNGYYLISGGAGTLGKILSESIQNEGGNVIWCGRRSLKEIPDGVEYYVCDTTNREQVIQMEQELKLKGRMLKGIFVCAGSINDSLLKDKDTFNMKLVLSTKIQSVRNLDEVFAKHSLDLFLMYSSIAAHIPSMGQSDYAFANAFLDSYAMYRERKRREGMRSGRTLSIAWPFFQNGGMQINSASLDFMKDSKGLNPLNAAQQYELIQKMYGACENSIVVLSGDSNILINQGKKNYSILQTDITAGELVPGTMQKLKEIAADILHEEADSFQSEEKFSNYGFDSITSIEFVNGVNQYFNLKIMPSVLFECTKFSTFSEYLVEHYRNEISRKIQMQSQINAINLMETDSEMVTSESALEEKQNDEDILAIVGMAGRFPKSRNLDEFWNHLAAQDDLVTTIPGNRWNWHDYWDESGDDIHKTNVIWGGFMEEVDTFDEKLFGISKREADYMNPQQRILLEAVWEVLENAGYKPSSLRGTNMGVFVGTAGSEYSDICLKNQVEISPYSSMSVSHAIDANRVSYYFDFHGPSESIDTACSSSLVALNRAVKAIRNGECQEAIVAGVNIILTPSLYIAFDKAGMLSKTGKCSAFDKDANGFVRGEGVGTIYIKPLKKALKDKDYIYGIVRGSGVNHGGDASSLTAPNTLAQKELIEKVYQSAHVDFDTVSYIEAHGTGTVLGDSVEVNALCSVYKDLCPMGSRYKINCGLGSVKTNMGHLETAAGIAGVIKVLLSMQHDLIPGNIHFHKQSPMIDLEDTPFYVQKDNTSWLRQSDSKGNAIPRRAGISSFGFGGANAHVILEDYMIQERNMDYKQYVLLPVSAQTKEQLVKMISNLYDYLINHEEVSLHDVAFTLQNGREEFDVRYIVCARDRQELLAFMKQYLDGAMSSSYLGTVSNNGQSDVIELTGNEELTILEKICERWVKGAKVLWKSYYQNADVRKILLPGYEFKKNKHWVKYRAKTTNNAQMQKLKRVWKIADNQSGSIIKNIIVLCGKKQEETDFVKQLEGVTAIITPDSIDYLSGQREVYLLDIRKSEEEGTFFDTTLKCFRYILSKAESFHYLYAFPVTDNKGRMAADALDSFCHSLWTEYGEEESSKFTYQIIGYEDFSVLNKVLTCQNEYWIYEKSNSFKQCMELIPLEESRPEKPGRLKEDGIYLIFGGTGGIGKITVKYLLDHTSGTVIVSGRSEQSEAILSLSEEYGNRIDYRRVDIGNVANVHELRKQILAQYGSINGIIHSAGLNHDGSFLTKRSDDFRSVLNVKVQGCLNLEYVFGQDQLDFMLLYTSVAAYYGSAGQTDYCLANRFMEAYAIDRNQRVEIGKAYGETLFIAWPVWKSTGMTTPEAIQRRIYQKYGMLPIEESQGIAILDRVLQGQEDSSGYVYGDHIKAPETKIETNTVCPQKVNNISLKDNVFVYIKELLTRLVGAEEIGFHTALEELCVDSIIITQFTERVQKDIGKIEKTILFECNDVGEIVEYMLEHYEEPFRKFFAERPDSKTTETTDITRDIKEEVRTIHTKESSCFSEKDDIAIIGFDGRFASADSVDELWKQLTCGADLIHKVPAGRWDNNKYYSKNAGQAVEGKYYCQNAGFLNVIDEFDPLFFHISPKEAELMDPQERLLLEMAWNTVEKAGYSKESIKRVLENEVGVFVGVTTHTYNLIGGEELYKGNPNIAKSESWSIANRISYFMNWKGPSLAVDTACSSSLTALHYACKSLQEQESKMVFVGGVNLYLHPAKFIYMSQMKMLSESGISSPFGENADGFVPGEGVGGMLLKTRRQAELDGDRIYGIIKGTAVNHDGMTNGYTVPNVKEQAKVILKALEISDVNPETISYVEAHGTGTRLGDPIEIAGLKRAWSEFTNRRQYCAIGSIKGNIGHSEGFAGLASMIKVLLQFQHKQLVPSIHSETLNSRIEFEDTPFYVQHDLEKWEPKDENNNPILRRAAVSSFGAGGTNVHVILEEYVNKEAQQRNISQDEGQFFTLSAKNRKQLEVYAEKMLDYLQLHRIETQDTNRADKSIELASVDAASKLAKLLEVPVDDLSITETFETYGMDRILLEQYKQTLRNVYGTDRHFRDITMEWSLGKLLDCIASDSQKKELEIQYDIDFTDFIYTSHAREAFDERMIIVAKNLNEVEQGLESFLGKIKKSTGMVMVHNVKQDPITGVPEWLNGNYGDWESIAHSARILDLPTYPFVKQCYWTPMVEESSYHYGNQILDENISTFAKQVYCKRFTKQNFYLADHVVNGISTLPGVFYLQMAQEAARQSLSKEHVFFKDVTWLQPLTVEEEVQATIELEHSETGCQFKILSPYGVHMQGSAMIYKKEEADLISLSIIQNRCQDSIPIDKFYHEFELSGIHYGRTFQAVQKISYGQQEVIAEIILPDGVNGLADFPLHPSLLDAALQTTAALKKMNNKDENRTFIPFGVKEVRIKNQLQEHCFSYVYGIKAESKMVTCNIQILGTDGAILAEFKEFSFRALESESQTNQSTDELHYYSPVWKTSQTPESKENSKPVLVFYDGEGIDKSFKERNHVIWIHSGKQFKKCSTNEYQICPNIANDYYKLFHELTESGVESFSVIHFWSDKYRVMQEEQYSEYIQYGIQSVFYICKAVVGAKDNQNMTFYLVNRLQKKSQNPFFTAVCGFLKTIHLEHGRIRMKSIEVDVSDNTVWDKISKELRYKGNEMEVRYWNETRQVKEIEKIIMSKKPQRGFETNHCVYLITGALGGLSRLMINKICQADNEAKLVLTDIMPEGTKSVGLLQKIAQYGKEAIYIPADLNSQEQVEHVVKKGKESFRQITCLIHTAGIIQDEIFRKKEFETFEKVLAPKVYGTLNLDHATKQEELEAFVLFSSLAAFGNTGQCDYSYANDFLVRFGEQRNILMQEGQRSGKTIVMNWPLWSDGGMKTDKQTEALFQHFGMRMLDSDAGMEALNISIGNDVKQIVVVQGIHKLIWKKLQSMFKLREDIKKQNPSQKVSAEVKNLFTEKIMELMRILLKLQEEIVLSVDISDYGFDSISITELVNKINDFYGLDLLPTNVFEYNTIQKFVDSVYQSNEQKLCEFYCNTMEQEVKELAETLTEPSEYKKNNVTYIQGEKQASISYNKEPIAVIGMSCRLPGAENVEAFWNNLLEQKDIIKEIPPDRWNWRNIYGDSHTESNKTFVKNAAFIDYIDEFDEELFGITNREAVFMDPVQRMALEESHRAIEDAGIKHSDLRDSNTGVYIGLVSMEYYEMVTKSMHEIDPYLSTGNSRAVTANRISYVYSLRGPSEVIDTACSSSIVAVERAIDDMRLGKCSMAIAGGVNAILSPQVHLAYSRTGMLSPDGKCKTFDESADGYGRGEGCGIMILKPLSKAIADHDPIHCLILGGGVNHTGHVNTLTTPNPVAQNEVIERAVREAGVPFRSIGFIETHGTGTKLGDPIEITGILNAEEHLNPEHLPHPCVLGALKSNIGHLEGAAGIAGMIKAAKALEENIIPANMNFTKKNSFIQLEETGFSLAQQKQQFPVITDEFGYAFPRRAGISSFGFGGVNAHIIMEDYEKRYGKVTENHAVHVMVLSTRTKDLLTQYIETIRIWICNRKEQDKQNVAWMQSMIYTLQEGKEAQACRMAIVFHSMEELENKLINFENLTEEQGIYRGTIEKKNKSRLVLEYSMSEAQLAKAFTTNAFLDWKACYLEEPQKIALPVRPLKKNRHWYHSKTQYKNLNDIIAKRIKVPDEMYRAKEIFETDMGELEAYCAVLIVKEFAKRGYFTREKETYSISELIETFKVKNQYRRLFTEILETLQKHNYACLEGEQFTTTVHIKETNRQNIEEMRTRFCQEHSGIQPHIHLLNQCLPHLLDIMEGKTIATDILFPNSSMDLVRPVYGENPGANYYNKLVVESVVAYIDEIREKEPDRVIRVLEVGAGTGGTSKDVVNEIGKRYQKVTYMYTDMSNAFLNYGRTMYGRTYAFMEFGLLNVEKDPLKQGFEPHSYDIVIGANVFHATKRLHNVMEHMKKLLKSSGWIVVNEITQIQAFLTLTFGLTDGWWPYEDEELRLKGGPLLSLNNWDKLFRKLGFDSVAGVDTILSGRIVPQEVVIARNSIEDVTMTDIPKGEKSTCDKEVPVHNQTIKQTVDTTLDNIQYLEQYVQEKIVEAIATTLMVDPETIDTNEPYSSYGVDSILGAECVNSINKILHVTVDTTELFNRTDIVQMAEFISEQYYDDLMQREDVKTFVNENEVSTMLSQYQNGEIDLDEIFNKLEIEYGER